MGENHRLISHAVVEQRSCAISIEIEMRFQSEQRSCGIFFNPEWMALL
ncbi:MAG: hypothetical protein WCR42_14485 [bacterium]